MLVMLSTGKVVPCFVFMVLSVGVIGLCLHFLKRVPAQRQVLDEWASSEGFTLEEVERRCLRCGPFWPSGRVGPSVFRITTKDASGGRRKGYVRLGNALGLGKSVKVVWDYKPGREVDVLDAEDYWREQDRRTGKRSEEL